MKLGSTRFWVSVSAATSVLFSLAGVPRVGRAGSQGDACWQTVALYGNPDSRGPSTKAGQPLELLYYAFDWAGPDVPQVVQVVCTPEKDGLPGQVVEITLAASSL